MNLLKQMEIRTFALPNNEKNGQALDRRPVSLSWLCGGTLV